MGCDIHFFVERKVDGKWISADKWQANKYAGQEGEPDMIIEYEDRFYRGRNYDLFAMLADVRNGYGFAGCDTGDGFTPIAEQKGVPRDVSPEVQAEIARWQGDGHSHSWFTLAELLAYDWKGQKTVHRGWVTPADFVVFERTGKPERACGGVDGPAVQHISHEEMREIVAKGPEAISAYDWSHYTQVEWEETYADCVPKFLDETMPKLEALSYGKPKNVRIVFFFDN